MEKKYTLKELKELGEKCYRGRWHTSKDQFAGMYVLFDFLETRKTEIEEEKELSNK